MIESLPLQQIKEDTAKTLAPVIPIRSVPQEKSQLKGKVLIRKERKTPLFYTKPIFKSKKHDLL